MLIGIAEQPGPGAIVTAEWDPEGTGRFEPFEVDWKPPECDCADDSRLRPAGYVFCLLPDRLPP